MNRLGRSCQGSWLRRLVRCRGVLCLMLVAVASMALKTPAVAGLPEAEAAYQRGDFNAAFNELKPLAEQGNAKAQGLLGTLYRDGKGVSQDYAQALSWFRKAASQGYELANVGLQGMYSSQQGVTKQEVREAALHGDAAAQMAMAVMLGSTGDPRDLGESYVWLNVVVANPNAGMLRMSAGLMVALMEHGLTPEQVAEGKKLVERFKAQMPAPQSSPAPVAGNPAPQSSPAQVAGNSSTRTFDCRSVEMQPPPSGPVVLEGFSVLTPTGPNWCLLNRNSQMVVLRASSLVGAPLQAQPSRAELVHTFEAHAERVVVKNRRIENQAALVTFVRDWAYAGFTTDRANSLVLLTESYPRMTLMKSSIVPEKYLGADCVRFSAVQEETGNSLSPTGVFTLELPDARLCLLPGIPGGLVLIAYSERFPKGENPRPRLAETLKPELSAFMQSLKFGGAP